MKMLLVLCVVLVSSFWDCDKNKALAETDAATEKDSREEMAVSASDDNSVKIDFLIKRTRKMEKNLNSYRTWYVDWQGFVAKKDKKSALENWLRLLGDGSADCSQDSWYCKDNKLPEGFSEEKFKASKKVPVLKNIQNLYDGFAKALNQEKDSAIATAIRALGSGTPSVGINGDVPANALDTVDTLLTAVQSALQKSVDTVGDKYSTKVTITLNKRKSKTTTASPKIAGENKMSKNKPVVAGENKMPKNKPSKKETL